MPFILFVVLEIKWRFLQYFLYSQPFEPHGEEAVVDDVSVFVVIQLLLLHQALQCLACRAEGRQAILQHKLFTHRRLHSTFAVASYFTLHILWSASYEVFSISPSNQQTFLFICLLSYVALGLLPRIFHESSRMWENSYLTRLKFPTLKK